MKRANILIPLLFAAVGGLIAKLILHSWKAAAIAFFAGIIAGGWVAARLARQSPPPLGKRIPLPAPAPGPDPVSSPEEAELLNLFGKLADANLEARLAGFDAGLLAPLEAVMDDLRPALEAMTARHPGDKLTWELARLCDRHVPRLVKEYADLGPSARDRRRDAILDTLSILADQVRRTADIVARDEADEFLAAANVIAAKFGTSVS